LESQHIKKYLFPIFKTAVKISLKGESLLARVRDGPFYTEFKNFWNHISEHSTSLAVEAQQRMAGNTIKRAITLSDSCVTRGKTTWWTGSGTRQVKLYEL
jgi:hypothetical protein